MTNHLALAGNLKAAATILLNRIKANPELPEPYKLFESTDLTVVHTTGAPEWIGAALAYHSSFDVVKTPFAKELSWFCVQAGTTIVGASYSGRWLLHQFGLFAYYFKGEPAEFLPALFNFAVALAGDSSGCLKLKAPLRQPFSGPCSD